MPEIGAWAVIMEADRYQTCAEAGLVLLARDIEHRIEGAGNHWRLAVPLEQLGEAQAELRQYARENVRAPPQRVLSETGNGWWGVLAYAATLLLAAIFAEQEVLGLDWLAAGRLDSSRLLDGEWWRATTALMLHADAGHLLANLAFGGFFGYFAGRYLGDGVAWAAILSTGILGNVLNALVQPPGHRAIGASTAVFGALGLLAAYTWRKGALRAATWRARLGPIVAAVALLAYIGTGGENTDVIAHLTGFIAGIALGVVLALLPRPPGRRVQCACAVGAGLAVLVSWGWGLAVAGA